MSRLKGFKHSDKAKQKMSEARKGKPTPWMVGRIVSLETRKKMSETRKGKPSTRRNYKHSEETKRKISIKLKNLPEEIRRKMNESHIGLHHSEETCKKMSNALKGNKRMLGKHHSKEIRRKISESQPKKNAHYNWKGGITPINKEIRASFEYKLWRESVFKRDNFICQWCKKVGGQLNADHIKMFALHPELRFVTDNGRTLCEPCHKWKTRMDYHIYFGKTPELNFV